MKFYNINEFKQKFKPLNIIIGGRGIGKTYSALTMLIDSGEMFMYLRNTRAQLDECCGDFGNPFKRWNKDHNRNISIAREKDHGVIIEKEDDGGEVKVLGYAAALSTFGNMRGVDFSDVRIVLFDEFIEKKPLLFDQYDAFSNFYETVNRNRELLGEDPLKVFLLSNAQKLDNPILAYYNLIPTIEGMIRTGQQSYSAPFLWLQLPESEISKAKQETAIYQAAKGTAFYEEAIQNKFAADSFAGIKKCPLVEYVGACQIDDVYVYKHKSNGSYYACSVRCENVPVYSSKNTFAFLRTWLQVLAAAYGMEKLYFSDFVVKTKLLKIVR